MTESEIARYFDENNPPLDAAVFSIVRIFGHHDDLHESKRLRRNGYCIWCNCVSPTAPVSEESPSDESHPYTQSASSNVMETRQIQHLFRRIIGKYPAGILNMWLAFQTPLAIIA